MLSCYTVVSHHDGALLHDNEVLCQHCRELYERGDGNANPGWHASITKTGQVGAGHYYCSKCNGYMEVL